jgi:hypothetical protein
MRRTVVLALGSLSLFHSEGLAQVGPRRLSILDGGSEPSASIVAADAGRTANPPPDRRFAIGPSYAFRTVQVSPPRERSLGPGPAAMVSDDGSLLVFINGRRTDLLRVGQRRRPLPTPRVYRADISPDRTRVVTSTEEGEISIFDVASRTRITGWSLPDRMSGGDIAFLDDQTVMYYSNCVLRRLPTAGGQPVIVPIRLCDPAAPFDLGFRVSLPSGAPYLAITQQDPDARYAEAQVYREIRVLDPRTGAVRLLLSGGSGLDVRDARLTSRGDRICFQTAAREVHCSTGGAPERIATGVTQRFMYFNPQGTQLLYVSDGPDGSRWLQLADFTTRTVRAIGPSDRESFGWSSDGSLLFAWSGANPNGLDVWDFDALAHASMYADVEVDYARDFPGGPRNFLLARARAGSNALSTATMPPFR